MRWLVATFLLSENRTLPGSLRSQHRISGSYTHTQTNINTHIYSYMSRLSRASEQTTCGYNFSNKYVSSL